jgi:hypothetical protein
MLTEMLPPRSASAPRFTTETVTVISPMRALVGMSTRVSAGAGSVAENVGGGSVGIETTTVVGGTTAVGGTATVGAVVGGRLLPGTFALGVGVPPIDPIATAPRTAKTETTAATTLTA